MVCSRKIKSRESLGGSDTLDAISCTGGMMNGERFCGVDLLILVRLYLTAARMGEQRVIAGPSKVHST